MLQPMEWQRVRHDLATEQQHTICLGNPIIADLFLFEWFDDRL